MRSRVINRQSCLTCSFARVCGNSRNRYESSYFSLVVFFPPSIQYHDVINPKDLVNDLESQTMIYFDRPLINLPLKLTPSLFNKASRIIEVLFRIILSERRLLIHGLDFFYKRMAFINDAFLWRSIELFGSMKGSLGEKVTQLVWRY